MQKRQGSPLPFSASAVINLIQLDTLTSDVIIQNKKAIVESSLKRIDVQLLY